MRAHRGCNLDSHSVPVERPDWWDIIVAVIEAVYNILVLFY